MDVEKILEEVRKDPKAIAKLADAVKGGDIQKALQEHGIDLEPEKAVELGKKLLAEGGGALEDLKNSGIVKDVVEKGEDLLKGDGAKDLLEKGEDLLKGLLGGKE